MLCFLTYILLYNPNTSKTKGKSKAFDQLAAAYAFAVGSTAYFRDRVGTVKTKAWASHYQLLYFAKPKS